MERSRIDFFLNGDMDVEKVSGFEYAVWSVRGGEREKESWTEF